MQHATQQVAFGLAYGLVTFPIFYFANKFVYDFVLGPVIVFLLGIFLGAAYEWEWAVGFPVGTGSVISASIVSHFAMHRALHITLASFLIGMYGVYRGVKSENK